MATVYSVLDTRDKNELNQTIQSTKTELQKNIDTLEGKHDDETDELQRQINTLNTEKATKAELSSHNTSNSAHNDIRLLIQNLTTRLNALADSDDTTLDQMSEIVAYIEANRDLIESITTSKVSVSDIVNNLTTNVANRPLSASMGVTLKALIDAIPDDTLDIVNEKIQEHNVAADAHEDIRTDVLTAQSTASAAQAAADNAQSSADAAQADVDDALSRLNSLEVGSGKLDREVSTTDGIVTCEDVLVDSGLIETKFYGKTVQNLWVNPSGTYNGLTATANSNGSVSFSGTVTKDSSFSIYSNTIYTLKPNTTYVFFIDKAITQSFVSGNLSVYIAQYRSDGLSATNNHNSHVGGLNSALSMFVTTTADIAYALIGCFASSAKIGDTVSGTYRVMLREATEAEIAQSKVLDDYWCPPGLSSIDEVEIVTAGKNLLSPNADDWESTGSTVATIDGDSITVSSETGSYKNVYMNIDALVGKTIYFGYESVHGSGYPVMQIVYSVDSEYKYVSSKNSPITIPGNAENVTIRLYSNNSDTSGNFSLTYEKPYLYIDGTVDFAPFSGLHSIPVPLSTHSLRSLPDGTRDELRIDVNGLCVFSENVFEKILDGSENWIYKAIGDSDDIDGYCNLMIDGTGHIDSIASYGNAKNILCNKLSTINPYSNNGPCIYAFEAFDGAGKYIGSELRIRVPNGGTVEQVKSWLSNNNTLILMNKMGPQTIYLGKIDPPRLPSSTSHVWINGTANTTNFTLPINDLYVRYWLPNGELVADIYDNGATEELSDTEIITIWDGATGNIVEATNADIEAIFD